MRHGDHLTYTTIITDPVFLAEPLVRTTDYYRLPVDPGAWLYACEDGEQILDRAPDNVPNYLPGQHPFLMEFSEKHKVPLLGALGGPETMYPEIVAKLRTATVAEGLARTSPSAGPPQVSLAVDPTPRDGEIHVLPLRKNISMLLGDGANIVVQTGDEGPLVIDTGAGQLSEKVIAAIRNLSPRPIQFIVNTSYRGDHTGGNVKLRAVGLDPSVQGSFFSRQFADAGVGATIMSHQNTANHLVATIAADGVPSDTFLEARRRTYHNEDELELFWLPNAVTDGDSIVHFRLADVIVAGDIFNTTQYPFIDLANGGSLQGEIEALNAILDRTIYRHEGEGGTLIVPGHGYLSEEHEVVEYRDMLVIVRDRVRDLIKKGSTLDQVKAARVTADYDTRYGANSGDWTTDKFVAMVYNSLKNPRVKK
jgi:glyoxylase-like metal-dependent hydrolase (beta-lactamase superfamily II)